MKHESEQDIDGAKLHLYRSDDEPKYGAVSMKLRAFRGASAMQITFANDFGSEPGKCVSTVSIQEIVETVEITGKKQEKIGRASCRERVYVLV